MPRPRTLPDGLILLLCILSVLSLVGALWIIPDRGGDFETFYLSAQAWAHGVTPYVVPANRVPNLAPPVLLPVFWLFTRLPYPTALTAWTLVSVGIVGATVPLLCRETGLRWFEALPLTLGIVPSALALGLGQISFLPLYALSAAWSAQRANRQARAGVWIGVLCVLKPFYGLFVLWLLWRRQWRSLAACAAVGIVALVLSVAFLGRYSLDYVRALQAITWQSHLYNVSVFGFAARVFGPGLDMGAARFTPLLESPVLQSLAGWLLAGAVAFWAVLGLRRFPDDTDRAFVIVSLAGMLLSPLAWIHYLPATLGPIVAVALRRRYWTVTGLLVLGLFPYQFLVNRAYGPLGTVAIGSWALAMTGWALAVAARRIDDQRGSAVLDIHWRRHPRVRDRALAPESHA